jgi:hypothetical protein
MSDRRQIVVLGLTITSSWGNGHATTYRALLRELAKRRHDVLFLERNVPWYADNRDLPRPPYARTALYSGLEELRDRFWRHVARTSSSSDRTYPTGSTSATGSARRRAG